MSDHYCPICFNGSSLRLTKGRTDYYECSNCGSLYCGMLDQDGLVGGEHEESRNQTQNHLRIERIDKMAFGIPKEEVRILDFGCGAGMLIEDLKKAGYIHVDGFDAYSEQYCRLPAKEQYHIVTAIEVFEHLAADYIELDAIWKSLVNGGRVMVETGILDAAFEDGHTIDDWFYINPAAGHSTIYSLHGLDLLLATHGFSPRQRFSNYVSHYQKVVR